MIASGKELKPLIDALTAALGLPPNLLSLELRIALNEIVTVKCEFCPDIQVDGVRKLEALSGTFELTEYRPRIDRVCPACGAKHQGPFQACSKCKTELDAGR